MGGVVYCKVSVSLQIDFSLFIRCRRFIFEFASVYFLKFYFEVSENGVTSERRIPSDTHRPTQHSNRQAKMARGMALLNF